MSLTNERKRFFALVRELNWKSTLAKEKLKKWYSEKYKKEISSFTDIPENDLRAINKALYEKTKKLNKMFDN